MIYFVRHGETIANTKSLYCGASDSPLTDKGIKQSNTAVNRLSNCPIDIIYSSQRNRCIYIANSLAKSKGISYQTDSRLNEYNFGILENLTYDIIKNKYSEILNIWTNEYDFVVPEGESQEMVDKRISDFAINELQTLCTKNVAVIAHQGTISKLLCRLFELERNDAWRFRINNGAVVKVDNSSEYCYMVIE